MINNSVVIISDVMVATGSTILKVLEEIAEHGKPKRYYIASVIAPPIAVEKLQKYADSRSIDLRMFTISIDPEINDKGYIVPGLGDYS
jgi:uracil phosphoribosyltransferase